MVLTVYYGHVLLDTTAITLGKGSTVVFTLTEAYQREVLLNGGRTRRAVTENHISLLVRTTAVGGIIVSAVTEDLVVTIGVRIMVTHPPVYYEKASF